MPRFCSRHELPPSVVRSTTVSPLLRPPSQPFRASLKVTAYQCAVTAPVERLRQGDAAVGARDDRRAYARHPDPAPVGALVHRHDRIGDAEATSGVHVAPPSAVLYNVAAARRDETGERRAEIHFLSWVSP